MPNQNPFLINMKIKKGKNANITSDEILKLATAGIYVSASLSLAKTIRDAAK